MKNLLNSADREALVRRLQKLRPGSERRWGKMTAVQILPHLADPFRVTFGEKPAHDVSNPVMRSFIGKLLVRFLPWPKSAFTSPDFLPDGGLTPPGDFETDRQSLILLMHRLANSPRDAHWEKHPVFGSLSRKDVGRLYWRHIDHHLRQFGV